MRVEGGDDVGEKTVQDLVCAFVRDGLIARTVYASVPPKVEYSLTLLGRSLTERIAAIREWAYDNIDEIEIARQDFDNRSRT